MDALLGMDRSTWLFLEPCVPLSDRVTELGHTCTGVRGATSFVGRDGGFDLLGLFHHESCDVVVASADAMTDGSLPHLMQVLRPGGTYLAPLQGEGDSADPDEGLCALALTGFLENVVEDWNGLWFVRAVKPTWSKGAKADVKTRNNISAVVHPPPAQTPEQHEQAPKAAPASSGAAPQQHGHGPAQVIASTWKMGADDLVDGTDDLIDEDALLAESAEATAAAGAANDAAAGTCGEDGQPKRRACANCTCGLAEREAAGDTAPLTTEQMEVKVSSCGNCSRGDAFRCASCPFLGKPAFEPGMEKVMLATTSDL